MRAAAVTMLLLAGCATAPPEPLAVRLERAYGERCRLAGYSPGSTPYNRCLLAASDRDRAAAAAAAARIGQSMQNQKPAGYTDPNLFKGTQPLIVPPPPVTCSSRPDGFGGWRTVCE